MITLTNGYPQGPNGLIVGNGSISFSLNVDATVIASPGGFVCSDVPVVFQFNAAGQIQPNSPATQAQIYSNAELNPQNSVGLGTYYLVTFYNQNGAKLNQSPLWWQFPEASGATVDISKMVAVSTVGGNVIYYPTSFAYTLPFPTPTALGGIYSNAGSPGQFITSINTDGTVSLATATISPAGTDMQVQINSGGAFYADSGFTYDPSTSSVSIGGAATIGGATLLQSTLGVTGAITAASALTVSGLAQLTDGLLVTGGTLGFEGYQVQIDGALSAFQSFTVLPTDNGSVFTSRSTGTGNITDEIQALGLQTLHTSTGTSPAVLGLQISVGSETISSGTPGIVTLGRGIHITGPALLTSPGPITTMTGIEIDKQAGATVTNSNAIYIDDQGAGGYGIKQAGTNTLNLFSNMQVAGQTIIATHTPSSSSDTGTTGQIAWDGSYIYICSATNTWLRAAIATW